MNTNGPKKIFGNWGVGLCTLNGNGDGWHDLTRYAWAGKYEGGGFVALQIRVLWFVVACCFKNLALAELERVVADSGYRVGRCGECERELICPGKLGDPLCWSCGPIE